MGFALYLGMAHKKQRLHRGAIRRRPVMARWPASIKTLEQAGRTPRNVNNGTA